MIAALMPPGLSLSYAVNADWIELLALISGEPVLPGDLSGPNDILEDRAARSVDPNDGDNDVDPDILDPAAEAAMNALFEELAFRQRVLGAAYPFDLAIEPRRFRLKPAPATGDPHQDQLRRIYLACLLMSALRSRLIDATRADIAVDPNIGDLFQICATVAAAGYLNGDAYWFGHPRPDQTPLIAAVAAVASRLNARVAQAAPPGASRFAKDAGIDVIAWRDHHDDRPAKIIIYGQCATGMNWQGKSVSPMVDGLGNYFHLRPSNYWLPALLTPFPIYMSKENAHSLTDEDQRAGFYRQTETVMGIIIDRLRLVRCCDAGLRSDAPCVADALARMTDVFQWSERTVQAIRAAA